MQKKILLINPLWQTGKDNIWSGVAGIIPPLGLASIASYLEQKGHTVQILDMIAKNVQIEELLNTQNFNDFDFIGITATTSLVKNAYKIANLLKSDETIKAKIFLGGVHPSIMPEEVFSESETDYVIRGEGEQTTLELVEEQVLSSIAGLTYKEDGIIKHNADRKLLKDINDLPIPAYHLLEMKSYKPALGSYKRLPGTGIITSRGCPGACAFCFNIFGRSLRLRSAEKVLEELKLLHTKYGMNEIAFYDDTFTASKKRVMAICRGLIDSEIKLSWSCFARVDFVDLEMLLLMREAGCHQIMYGIESASQEILNNIDKKTDIDKALNAIKWTKQAKIEARAAFMLGNPGETELTIEESFQFALKLDPDRIIFNITTPYPGTRMYNWAKEHDYITTNNWNDYDLAHTVMELPTISSKRINELYKQLHNRFYLRPIFIFKHMKKLKSLLEIKNSFIAFKVLLKMKFLVLKNKFY